jgi:uncharacterized small protein (DUF1192 family)
MTWILLFLLLAPAASLYGEDYLHHTIESRVVVAWPEDAARTIVRWAEQRGGYFVLHSTERVVIRFPDEHVKQMHSFLQQTCDHVLEYSPRVTDLREDLLSVRSGIRSREEILEKNMSFIDRADVTGTLEIEKEIMQLVEEIERLKGKRRKLLVDKDYAVADIGLRFKEQTLPDSIPSSFDWINSVDFYRFMQKEF